MDVVVAVGNIQGKSRFTVAEGESINFKRAEDGIMVLLRHSNTGLVFSGGQRYLMGRTCLFSLGRPPF